MLVRATCRVPRGLRPVRAAAVVMITATMSQPSQVMVRILYDRAMAKNSTSAIDIGSRVRANDQASPDYKGREGFVTELGPGKSEYRVEFDDGRKPTTGYLMAGWLDISD